MNCEGISKHTIKGILLQIVRAYPLAETNGFAYLSGFSELSKSNLGKKYADYQNGSFWARDWEAAGADPNELCREFPLVLLESPEIKISNGQECRKYAVSVIGQYECKECGRTREEVGCDTETILKNIINELKAFGRFYDGEKEVWASKQYGVAQGWEYLEECLDDILEGQELSIFEISRNMPNLIGWSVQFDICDCVSPQDLVFNYQDAPIPCVGVVECDDCP